VAFHPPRAFSVERSVFEYNFDKARSQMKFHVLPLSSRNNAMSIVADTAVIKPVCTDSRIILLMISSEAA